MNLTSKNAFFKLAVMSFFAIALVFGSVPTQVNAAADIAIASANVTSATTVVVTFVNPGHNLASVDATKWHIDVGGGGATPLTPTSAVVTSAGTPWTVTLTFAAGSFTATDTAYAAAVGLYADASAVTDTNGDTNAVVGHAASIAIADGQSPTFTAARTALNTIVLTFSENVDAADTATAAWTVAGATVTSVTDPAVSTALTITTTGLTSTSSTPAVNYIAASGTVTDVSAATNEVANGGAVAAADQVPPTLAITLSDYALDEGETATATFTFSEAPTNFTSADVTAPNGTLGAIDTTNPLVQTATFTPTADSNYSTNVISVGTSWTDSSAALNAPASTNSSDNFSIDTRTSTSSSGGGGSRANKATPAVPANTEKPADCTAGVMFSPSTGRNCNAAAPAIPAGCTASTSFSPLNGQKCSTVGTTTTTTVVSPAGNPGNAYAFGNMTVKMGTKGEACKVWQMFLNSKANAGLATDGACGPKTMAAAKSWQASAGLKADGLLGAMSRAKAMMQ